MLPAMNFLTIFFKRSRPYGQPGQKPEMATLLPYWLGITLKKKLAA